MPTLGTDRSSVAIDRQVNELLAGNRHDGPASGLVIGAGTRVGTFSQRFPNVEFLTTDVDVTYSPDAIADALALPIADQSIDLVVCEHVVEHVIDPLRAALEIERVLRPGGIALIKMPFLYPWHGGYIDFFRATPAGMIVLFAGCEVVHLGPGMGPGAAAAYALFDGGVEFFGNAHLRRLAVGILRVALSPLKWLDPFLTRRFQSVGGSAGITFIGRKTDERLSPQEMVATARRLGKRGLAGADRIPSPA